MKRQNDTKRAQAQDLWVKGALTQSKMAEIVGTSEKTLRAWAKEGDWDKMKTVQSVTRKALYEKTLLMIDAVHREIGDGTPNKTQYDSLSILGKQLEQLGDTSIAQVLNVFNDFLSWLQQHHPKEVKNYALLSSQFVKSL